MVITRIIIIIIIIIITMDCPTMCTQYIDISLFTVSVATITHHCW